MSEDYYPGKRRDDYIAQAEAWLVSASDPERKYAPETTALAVATAQVYATLAVAVDGA